MLLLVLSVTPTDPRVSAPSVHQVGHLCGYLVFAWLLVQALPPTWPLATVKPQRMLPAKPYAASSPARVAKLVGGQAIRATRLPAALDGQQPDAAQAGLRERESLLWAWLYATSYGGLMELLQMVLPWRRADWTDALMNALGAALGVWLGRRWPSATSPKLS